MRVDIMTDIETLGTDADSTIIQISAIAFDILTGEHLSIFNQIADISKNEKDIKVTGRTIQWWLNTNKELFAELINGGEYSSETILGNFKEWIEAQTSNTKDVYLWGNGILFDNKMIQHQLESNGYGYPIFYKNDRDVRTIVDLAGKKLGITEQELKDKYKNESLVEHNALDDVKYQINLVVGCYNELIK